MLVRALTHRSFTAEARPGQIPLDNEQLEFFGDSILSFLISDELIARHSELGEGRLTRARAQMVSARRLHWVAEAIGLGEFLRLGRGEENSGGRGKANLLADALEALIAALYVDGGLQAARKLVVEHVWSDELASQPEQTNYKGLLWELAGASKQPHPAYRVVEMTGPAHLPHFVVEVEMGELTAQGEGSSKKEAEQHAAQALIAAWQSVPAASS